MGKRGLHRPDAQEVLGLYERLLAEIGPRNWWPTPNGGGGFEITCGAILTQNTQWRNAAGSLSSMKSAGYWDFPAVLNADPSELAAVIRPSGYHNTKARKLQTFAAVVVDEFDNNLQALFDLDLPVLRDRLLGVWGIGEETADDIVLYAANKPSFVIDRYTTRLVDRLGWRVGGKGRYADYKEMFESLLPRDVPLYNEFHAVIDGHGARTCTSRNPSCERCCLLDICVTGRSRLVAADS